MHFRSVSPARFLCPVAVLIACAGIAFAGPAPAPRLTIMQTPDGAGGAIFVFLESSHFLAQRMDAAGNQLWPAAGIPLSTVLVGEQDAAVTTDGVGGVIVTWLDARSGVLRVYAQRIDVTGTTRWDPAGIELNSAPSGTPDIASDGAGGALVTWPDTRGATASDIYIQHVSSAGSPLWGAGGVALATTSSAETNPKVLGDDAGGAIVTWTSVPTAPRLVRAQRVDGSGTIQWTAGGIPIMSKAGVMEMTTDDAGGILATCVGDSGEAFIAQRVTVDGLLPWGSGGSVIASFQLFVTWGLFPALVSDGHGGAFVAWYGGTQAIGDQNLYTQRLDAAGQEQWASNVILETGSTSGQLPTIEPDGGGGAIIAWENGNDVHAQRLDRSGGMLWTAGGVPVCTAPRTQAPLGIVPDGTGGATIDWGDWRNGLSSEDVYAQRLSADGVPQWRPNGRPVYLQLIGQRSPSIVADGTGGAIAAWMEVVDGIYQVRAQHRNGFGDPSGTVHVLSSIDAPKTGPFVESDGAGGAIVLWSAAQPGNYDAYSIYAQRLDAGDVVRWTPEGVLVAAGVQLSGASAVCSDGAGGAFVTYNPRTIGAQHVDQNGALPWGPGGMVVSNASQSSYSGPSGACIVADGLGGAIVSWSDARWYDSFCIHGCGTALFVQRLDATGAASWTANGVLLRSPINSARGTPEIATDGGGGAFVVWDDGRNGGLAVYGQHVDAAGNFAWPADGAALSGTDASHPTLIANEPGHAIVAWSDSRSGTGLDLYAQRITYPPGAWAAGGVPLCVAAGDQNRPVLAADGAGGAIAAWSDSRNDAALDVYAQKIDDTGALAWDPAGVAVSTGPGAQILPVIAAEPDGGALVAWQDGRGGFAPAISFQRLSAQGLPMWAQNTVGVGSGLMSGLALSGIHPNPARREFSASFSLPDAGPALLELLDVSGRRVASLEVGGQNAGPRSAMLRAPARPGLYFVRLVHASGTRMTRVVLLQ